MKRLLFLLALLCTAPAAAQVCQGNNSVVVGVVGGECYTTTDRFTAGGATSTAVTPPYSFRANQQIELTGSTTSRGAAAFSDANVYTGSGPANHIHSFQAVTLQILLDGNVEWYRGFTAGPVVSGKGTLANLAMHNAENPTGLGAVTNLFGLRCSPLNRGSSSNWCVYAEGPTPSRFEGPLGSDTYVSVTGDGSDDVALGPFFFLSNTAGNRQWIFQLNGSNDVDVWNYNGSAWIVMLTLTHGGVKVPSLVGSGDRPVKATSAGLLIAP